jgi:hypothetical protein
MKSPIQLSLAESLLGSLDPPPLGYRAQSIDPNISADLVRFHLYCQRTTEERLILGAKYRQNAKKSISYQNSQNCCNGFNPR